MPYPTNTSASDVWSMRDVYKARAGGNWAFPPPIAPTTVTATGEDDSESTVSFSGQTVYGSSPTFTVTSNPDNITATGSSSPITVTGLTNFIEYTFTVTIDDGGGSVTSDSSDAVTPTPPDTNGSLYAGSYLETTGGSLIRVDSPGSINSIIDGANDGDAILLTPGSYTVLPADGGRDPFRLKNLLIVGNSDDASDIFIDYNPDGGPDGEQRDHPVFINSGYTTDSTTYKQIAFCSLFRNADNYFGTNYSNSLVKRTNDPKAIAINVYFDLDNEGVSWHYDNGGSSNIDIKFIRCTFANYSTWQSSYSGRDDVIDVGNCLFSGSIETGEFIDLGGNVTNASINETSRTYSTSTYSSAGHLYVPNTDAIF